MKRISITTLALLVLPFLMNLAEIFHLITANRFMIERVTELLMIIILALCAIALLLYGKETVRIYETEYYNIQDGEIYHFFWLSGLRWTWEILLYFLTVSFHLYSISFTMRTHFTHSLVVYIRKSKMDG